MIQRSTIGTELEKIIESYVGHIECPACRRTVISLNGHTADTIALKRDELVETIYKRGRQLLNPALKVALKLGSQPAKRVINVWLDRAIAAGTVQASVPQIRSVETRRTWAVGVTTAPRKDPTLTACIDSLHAAGFDPVVFAEPGSERTNARVMQNETKRGCWHNWLHTARWLLEHTDADVLMTVQDDAVFHPDSLEFADSVLWPREDTAFVSLYTPKHYQLKAGDPERWGPGVRRVTTTSLWGTLAVAWDRDTLAKVVDHHIAKTWLGVGPRKKCARPAHFQARRQDPSSINNADTAVGKICNLLGRSMWFLDPSPVVHIAKHSAIAHGDNSGRRNCHRCADHDKPLAEQIPFAGYTVKTTPGAYIRDRYVETGEARYDAGRLRMHILKHKLSWGVPLDLWRAIRDEVQPDDSTLEFGCGTSTTAFESAAHHTAVEQNRQQAKLFRSAVYAPLNADRWYDWQPTRKHRVILIDGPFRGDRKAGIGCIMEAAADDAVIFVDDIMRVEESELFNELATRMDKTATRHGTWGVLR
jgi:hypothetical protein